eukprot:GHVR01000916.1.p1 GENE.GHVR01000916.1~~GHVR01000916.1.p1  ORF type:complete len:101 (+),score=2.59 GHVR01000916.1:618-920(+)
MKQRMGYKRHKNTKRVETPFSLSSNAASSADALESCNLASGNTIKLGYCCPPTRLLYQLVELSTRVVLHVYVHGTRHQCTGGLQDVSRADDKVVHEVDPG